MKDFFQYRESLNEAKTEKVKKGWKKAPPVVNGPSFEKICDSFVPWKFNKFEDVQKNKKMYNVYWDGVMKGLDRWAIETRTTRGGKPGWPMPWELKGVSLDHPSIAKYKGRGKKPETAHQWERALKDPKVQEYLRPYYMKDRSTNHLVLKPIWDEMQRVPGGYDELMGKGYNNVFVDEKYYAPELSNDYFEPYPFVLGAPENRGTLGFELDKCYVILGSGGAVPKFTKISKITVPKNFNADKFAKYLLRRFYDNPKDPIFKGLVEPSLLKKLG